VRPFIVGVPTAGLDSGARRGPRVGWRTAFWLVPIVLGLGGTACGEITAFCLSAGAPSGVTLEVTITPTPDGNRITCGPARPDSSRQQGVAPRGHADSLEGTAR
jgi:hypothetical protein